MWYIRKCLEIELEVKGVLPSGQPLRIKPPWPPLQPAVLVKGHTVQPLI